MKTLTLQEVSGENVVKRHKFTEHESEIFTLLVKLTGDEAGFSIESAEEDMVSSFGASTEEMSINLNQPVILKKDGENVSLKVKNPGFHHFYVDMSDASNPMLRVKAELEDGNSQGSGLEHLLNSKLPVSFEIGRTKMFIEDVLSLGQGSVIELDRLVGEELDVYIGEVLAAKAEVVVTKDQFGARLTKVMPVASEMATNLKLSPGEAL